MVEETNITVVVISKIVDNLPTIITAIGAILATWWSYKAKTQSTENSVVLTTQTATLKDVEKKVDGMTSELVAATAGKHRAEGEIRGRDDEMARHADAAPALPLPPIPVPVPVVATTKEPIQVQLVEGSEGSEKP